MASAFGKRLRELRTESGILQSAFAETCNISAAYLSDIERGRRNPPADKVILEWAGYLDPGDSEEIGQQLIGLAAQDQGRADAVFETVTEPSDRQWAAVGPKSGEKRAGKSDTPFMDHFCVDLVARGREGSLDAAPGRSQDFAEIAWRFGCRQRNSIVLVSEVAAETHRVATGLACEIAEGRATEPLTDVRLMMVDGGLQAGVKYRGQFEERLHQMLGEAAKKNNVVLYLPSLGDLVALDANAKGSFFRLALEQGSVRILSGTTSSELEYCRAANGALVDCFRPHRLRELDRDEVLRALYEVKDRFEAHHAVTYTQEALVAIVDAAETGERSRLWQRALDVMDEAGSRLKMEGGKEVTVEGVDGITASTV